jgi:glutathione peroxidase-family protein
MKKILITLLLPLSLLSPGSSFYSLSYTRIDGTVIPFSTLQGKKVVLLAFDGIRTDWGLLRAVDSLQKLRPDSLAVIAFPALDFDTGVNVSYLQHIHDSLGLGLPLAAPGYVQRRAGQGQQSVFQWLTTMSQNTHFNRDVEADGQLFIVSGKGTLYAVIQKLAFSMVFPAALRQKVWGE